MPITQNKDDYKPGDVVTWNLGVGHIGMVTDLKNTETGNYIIIHNAGRGPQLEDVLFSWPITGHYRYQGIK